MGSVSVAVKVSVFKQICCTFSCLLALLSMATLVFGFYAIASEPVSPDTSKDPVETANFQSTNPFLNELQSPVCAWRWRSLDALDFGVFAWVAYDDNEETMENVLNQYFLYRGKTSMQDWEIMDTSPPESPVFFFVARSPSNNITVVATRGTAKLSDWLENIAVWSEGGLLDIVSVLIPLNNILPVDVISKYVELTSVVENVYDDGPIYYFGSVEEQLQASQTRFPNDTFFLAGHSLGGGVSKIVGARQNVPAITLSSPGVLFLKDKLRFSETSLNNNGVTISARFDIVPFFGRHGGTYAAVDCTSSTLDPLDCHDSGRLICGTFTTCGLGGNSELWDLFRCEHYS